MAQKVFLNALPTDSLKYAELRDALAAKGFELVITRFEHARMNEIIAAVKGCCAVISNGETWNRQAIDAVREDVRIFVRHGVGVNTLDIPYLSACGIPLYNVGDANSAEVAEVALFHILGAVRKMCFAIEKARQGFAGDIGLFFGHGLDGKIVGLAGAGNIARNLARMLKGFEVRVIAYDPYVAKETVKGYDIELVDSMESLFSTADVVSLHLPLNHETEGCVNKRLLSLMKPGACLVNTCRGAVVNEAELIDALRSGRVAAAGLDVVAHEPICPEDPLYALENVAITPHIGANSHEAVLKYTRVITRVIEGYFKGEPAPGVLNPGYARNTEEGGQHE